MILSYVIYGVLAVGFALLQSMLPISFSVLGVLPDLSFVVTVFFAFMNGVMPGQVVGFVAGIFMDFMSLGPFGFNAFVRSLTSHIIGRFRGVIQLDAIFLPMALVAASYVLKFIVVMILGLILGLQHILERLFSIQTLVEFALTVAATPFLFWPLRVIHNLLARRRAYS